MTGILAFLVTGEISPYPHVVTVVVEKYVISSRLTELLLEKFQSVSSVISVK